MDISTPSLLPLEKHVALITGGGRGIGAATAEALALKGARIIVVSRTEKELTDTITRLSDAGLDASARVLDIADDVAVESMFKWIADEFSRLDILVNNAAILISGAFEDIDMKDWDRLMAINLRGAVLCSRYAFRLMREHGGIIINISSLGGLQNTEKFSGYAAYTVSKFALIGLTEVLAVEGKANNIRVNCIAPGAVATDMLRSAAPQLYTCTTPTDIAKVIAFLCDSSISSCINGTTLVIDSNL